MSAFQVIVTPPHRVRRQESREPTDVIMAPFSAKAIVQFEDVPVSKTAKRILRITNPTDGDILVKITKPIKAGCNITVNWSENTIPSDATVEMEMIWSPIIAVCCKETMQLTDNRNFRKDVTIILKSVSNKPPKNTHKFPTLSSGIGKNIKTLRLKSPTGTNKNKKITHQSQQQRRRSNSFSKLEKPTHLSKTEVLSTPPNRKQLHNEVLLQTLTKKDRSQQHVTPLTQRNSFGYDCSGVNVSPLVLDLNIVTHKENISPGTPNNILNLIDNMNFTPATETRTAFNDSLASWRTPLNTKDTKRNSLELLARHATDDAATNISTNKDLLEIPIKELFNNTRDGAAAIISDKTFEVKSTEISFDCSPDESLQEGRLSSSNSGNMNKTEIISATAMVRPLEMIREEEGNCSNITTDNIVMQKTFCKTSAAVEETKVIKRDINRVLTPLRKYSESMRDLSLSSPTSKLAIQGSMPNLNEMENIRSIEQNRYFFQTASSKASSSISILLETTSVKPLKNIVENSLDDSNDNSSSSQTSLVSHADNMFNHNEILAQSSRFNINEIGRISRNQSPDKYKLKKTSTRSSPSNNVTNHSIHQTESGRIKRSSRELYLSDSSPSNESIVSSCSTTKTYSKSGFMKVSPSKRLRIDTEQSFQRPAPVNSSTTRVNWSQAKTNKFKTVKTLKLVKNAVTLQKPKCDERIRLYDSDLYLQTFINPDPFAATTTCDPFLASTMYLDEHAVNKHQKDFRKWLNALVTLPADLNSDCNAKIDVGKLFNEVRNKNLILAPTKEEQSMSYLTNCRLQSLRKAAVQLYMSEEMREPCSKVVVYINKNAIRIRSDRNLHLDVVLQRYILELLLCFNPLWLRLGLEVVYGEIIHLHSNNDVVGLSTFVLNRLFRDKLLEQTFAKPAMISEEYAEKIKKLTLQKVLMLLLFLDKAKNQRIIKHNPCLFVKTSPYKETKDILLKFSSELLANIGDITRELKRFGYVLQHKQTFLDEFDYAFNNLAIDLRDGIRLTRVMEIILLREDLSKQLRVPAISRLQRIFNVNLALRALSDADFQLSGNITAADIVDGHREKTLSLLWQIIYKFRSPKFHAAAKVLQNWWRKSWLRVIIQRRIRRKEEERREAAATFIQAAFRAHMTRRYVDVFRKERISSAIVLQKHCRRFIAQRRFYQLVSAIMKLQRWYRSWRETKSIRQQFLLLRNDTVFIQRCFRRWLFAKKLLQAAIIIKDIQAEARMRHEKALILQRSLRSYMLHRKFQNTVHEALRKKRQNSLEFKSAAKLQSFFKSIHLRREFQRKRSAATCIQQYWRCYRKMQSAQQQFKLKRQCVIVLQRRFRAKLQGKQQQQSFQDLRLATIKLQTRFRAQRQMLQARGSYLQLKRVTIQVQQRYRAIAAMREQRASYLRARAAAIRIQQSIRATLAMRKERIAFRRRRQAACCIQRRYRGYLLMKVQRKAYLQTLQCVIRIQRKWLATRLARRIRADFISLQYFTSVMQQKYRSRKLMRLQVTTFQKLKATTIYIQRHFRAKLQLRAIRQDFLSKREAALTLQRHYRANKLMRYWRAKYRGTRYATICIQQHFRSYLLMKRERAAFKLKQNAALILQRAFRSHQYMRTARAQFLQLRRCIINVQLRFRATNCMQQTRAKYQQQRCLIIAVQRRFRAKLLGRAVRQEYAHTRFLIVQMQRRYRGKIQMRQQHKDFVDTRLKLIKIQRFIRAYLEMRRTKKAFQRMRQSTIFIQRWYRSKLQARKQKTAYQRIRTCAIIIQTKWRATLVMREQRQRYKDTVNAVITIQRYMRATLLMRKQQLYYQKQKLAAITLQRCYRARLEMLKMRSQYQLIRSLTICIQRKFRAQRAMFVDKYKFELLKRTTIHLQQKYRGRSQMLVAREQFLQLKEFTLSFQACARGFIARKRFQAMLTPEMLELLRRKKAARTIQRYWRGYRIRKRWHNARILTIRKNIKLLKETKTAVNCVAFKIRNAVKVLRGRHSTPEAQNVLIKLERVSRTVPHLLMGESEFICNFCYGLMAQTIRSVVDAKIIENCGRIILNLARYNSTTVNTFQKNGLITIAQMLLRWCDKDCEIFNILCTLIWVFAHCPEKQKIIREYMTAKDAIYVVREIKKLVTRKEKMKQNLRKNQVAPSTPRSGHHQFNFSSSALPSLDPDYGIIRNKPYTFISSVYAFDTILCKLGIDLF